MDIEQNRKKYFIKNFPQYWNPTQNFPRFSSVRIRANKYKLNQKQNEIFRENQYLVKKITEIHLNSRKPNVPYIRSLSTFYGRTAKKIRENIYKENKRLLFNIMNQCPTFSKNRQELEYKWATDYIKNKQKSGNGSYKIL